MCECHSVGLSLNGNQLSLTFPHTVPFPLHSSYAYPILPSNDVSSKNGAHSLDPKRGRKDFPFGMKRSTLEPRAHELQNIRAKLPNTMKIFLPSSRPSVVEGRRGRRGGGIRNVCIWSDWTFTRILPHIFHPKKGGKKKAEALADHHIITRSLIARPLTESRQGAPCVYVSSASLTDFSLPACDPRWNTESRQHLTCYFHLPIHHPPFNCL